MSAHTLFISDLHLHNGAEQATETLFRLLDSQARGADALYILGDFFEAWVGDDNMTFYNMKIINALKDLTTSGIPVYFMRGNRDFLVGKKFAKKTGVQLIKDPTVIDLYGKKMLLMHGDSLCTKDIKHQKLRKRMHNKLYQTVLLTILPLSYRRKLASQYREQSRNRQQTLTQEIMDVTQEEVTRVMREYNVLQMIHGHTHRPDIHKINVDEQPGKRIVLGSWHDAGSVFVYNADSTFELKTLAFN